MSSQTLSIKLTINACHKWLKMKTKEKYRISFKKHNSTAQILCTILIKVDIIFISKCADSKFEIPDKSTRIAGDPNQLHFWLPSYSAWATNISKNAAYIVLSVIHLYWDNCYTLTVLSWYDCFREDLNSISNSPFLC